MVENNTENLDPKVELEQQETVETPAAEAAPKAAKTVVAESADFDWDALEEEDKGFGGKNKKDLESLYEKTLTTVQ